MPQCLEHPACLFELCLTLSISDHSLPCIPLSAAVVPGLLMLFGALFMPDSPASLVERGMLDEARKVLKFFRRSNDVEEEVQELLEIKLEMEAVSKSQWSTIITRRYRPMLIVAILIPA